jgi:O-antigen ligase
MNAAPAAAGTRAFTILLALYYGTVLLAGLHFTVLQVLTLWGIALLCLPRLRAPLSRREGELLLALTAIFAVAVASYLANRLWAHPDGNLSRYARFLFVIPIYLVARRYATASGFWGALLLGTLATGLAGVLEFAGVLRRPDDIWREVSGVVNPIQFGDLSLAMAAMVAAGLPVYRRQGQAVLLAALAAMLLALFACLASATRGAWVAMPLLALLLAWGHQRTGFLGARRLLTAGLVAALLAAILVPNTNFVSQVQDAVQELRDYRHGRVGMSIGTRFEMWRAAAELVRRDPVLGVGPGLYRARVAALVAEQGGYDPRVLEYSHPHNEYLFVLVTLGSLGLLALTLLFGVPLYRFGCALLSGDAQQAPSALAGVILVVGYLQFGLTEALMFQHATFLGFYLISVAVLATLVDTRPRGPASGGMQQ